MTFEFEAGGTGRAAGIVQAPECGKANALCVPATIDSLEPVTGFVLGLGKQARLTDSSLYRFRLAADELVTNIVVHGYRGEPGQITVDGGIDPGDVWVRFQDDAPAFDPRQGMREPALDVPLAERQIGGLGVFLAFTAVDTFEYELVAGRNVSTLVMRRPAVE
ncbi:ATP-binding protein (plasmid) [Streptomyces sp. NBC_01387]|uniref:ATP-binding protein n=1 Tax=unclassified Streptomyces TaxID=2593676 RepID=UPI002024A299|nr:MULTISPECIES: anti-sigma regulatory factor [unclassified Streptomyces]MCX4554497.1 ATP-binding protein [Streptomyces sp. NBC_01500]WSC25120.1 ATP-binding protein [Streptomyces sp. NBC_01766]WSV58999.1 ATP-binding protein [Streptomyces sp. NBC_01014]